MRFTFTRPMVIASVFAGAVAWLVLCLVGFMWASKVALSDDSRLVVFDVWEVRIVFGLFLLVGAKYFIRAIRGIGR